jgi:hypothetical protein
MDTLDGRIWRSGTSAKRRRDSLRLALLLAVLTAGAPGAAAAQDGEEAAATSTVTSTPRGADAPSASKARSEAPRSPLLFGLAFDVGLPDAAALSVLVRPVPYLRVGAALLYDYLGYGVRGSVSIQPHWVIAPSLGVAVGHLFDAAGYTTLSQAEPALFGNPALRPMLDHLGYTLASVEVGLELGHPDWFVIFARAGLSRVWTTVHGLGPALSGTSTSSAVTFAADDPGITLQIPSAKVGLLVHFH